MKKLFYLMLLLLVMPFIVNAKELELKSIEPVGSYSDAVAELTGSEDASINFFIDGTKFSPITKYNLTIENSSNNVYTLDLDYLNTDDMKVKTNIGELKPGSNKIELTIEREEIDPRFYFSVPSSEAKLISSMKENPNTGLTIAKVIIFATLLTVIALALYIKTKHSSSFFIFVLLLIIPGIIIAKESTTFRIKINTFINLKYEACMFGRNYFEDPDDFFNQIVTYTFSSDETILNTNDDQKILQDIFKTSTKLTKDNILSVLRNMENTYVYEKDEIEKHFLQFDDTTRKYLPVDGKENLTYEITEEFMNGSTVIAYDETNKKLEVMFGFAEPVLFEEYSYPVLLGKVTFNKSNNNYYLDVQDIIAYEPSNDEYYDDFADYIDTFGLRLIDNGVTNVMDAIFSYMKDNMVPVINLKTHVDKIFNYYPGVERVYSPGSGYKYYYNDKELTQDEAFAIDFPDDLFYFFEEDTEFGDIYNAVFKQSLNKLNNSGRRMEQLFMVTNYEEYRMNSSSVIKYDNNTNIFEGSQTYLDINQKYLVVYTKPTCYMIGIPY